MNSYIWLSLETLKEVEITKEGLVIHHHPDMCTYRTGTIQKKSQRQTETHREEEEEEAQKKHLILGPVFLKKKKDKKKA